MSGKPIDNAPEHLLDVLRAMRSASTQCYNFADRVEAALIADGERRGAAQQQEQGGGEGGGEVNMDVTVRDGTWVGTYAEWRRRKQVGRTAPPSVPVGVEWTDERIIAVCKAAGVRWIEADEEEGGFPGGFDITHMPEMRRLFAALAQQPAAVDEAMVERAAAAVMSAPPGISVEAYVRIVLEAAIATKHQEPKKSKTKA